MIVMKFGGTSVQDEAAIQRVAQCVRQRLREQPIVVVSALAGVTDDLLEMLCAAGDGRRNDALAILHKISKRHQQLLEQLAGKNAESATAMTSRLVLDSVEAHIRDIHSEITPRLTDQVLGVGELLSSHMVADAFNAAGIPSIWIDAREYIITDANHTNAIPNVEQSAARLRERIPSLVSAGSVPVMGGFLGATAEGVPTTLGRGGSDLSASVIGAALNAERIEIWTDVEGIMTTDPRMCPEARPIDVISFDEAAELAYFGAKVLHPATLIPAMRQNIPVLVLNSRNPNGNGTCICVGAPRSRTTFRAIAAKRDLLAINVRSPRILGTNGFLRGVFEALERHGSAADLVSTSEVGVSIALQRSRDVDSLLHDLRKLGEVEAEDDKAIVCLVGKDIHGQVGIAARIFETIATAGINVHMISQGASEINVGFVIEDSDVPEAVRALHRRFFESESTTLSASPPALAPALPTQPYPDGISAQPEVG